jgi:mono/diheme cytochrome c family protein
MNKRWVLILLTGILILSLSACTGSPSPTQTAEPTPAPTDDMDTDTEEGHDDDTDAAVDSDSDSEDDDDEAATIDAAAIFSARCSSCHGADREGGGGPPLLPANLTKDPSAYVETITNGSGRMPIWGGQLSADEINALVDFIMSDS